MTLRTRVALGVFWAVLGAVAPAIAQATPEGSWTFRTEEMPDSCTMTGDMHILATSNASRFTCNFNAVQTCRSRMPRTIHTTQSCTISLAGAQVSMVSKIERIDKVDPPSEAVGMDQRYAPDNFVVALEPSGEVMTGAFLSWGRVQSTVRFERREDLNS